MTKKRDPLTLSAYQKIALLVHILAWGALIGLPEEYQPIGVVLLLASPLLYFRDAFFAEVEKWKAKRVKEAPPPPNPKAALGSIPKPQAMPRGKHGKR